MADIYQVQIRSGTSSQVNTFTGAAGELTFDTDTGQLRVHDGSTVGGLKLAFLDNPTFTNFTSNGIDDNASTTAITIDSSGKVGIGTSSPGKTLDVDGQLRIRNAGPSGYALLEYGASPTATNNWHVGSEGDGSFRFYNGTFGAGTERMRIDSSGNLLLGGSSSPASATKSFAIFNGTAPTGSVTNGVIVYAEDVSTSSELKVRDEAGNITTLSPHNFSQIPEGPSEDMAFSYYSEKDNKYINVDMLAVVRELEKLSGKQFVYTGSKRRMK